MVPASQLMLVVKEWVLTTGSSTDGNGSDEVRKGRAAPVADRDVCGSDDVSRAVPTKTRDTGLIPKASSRDSALLQDRMLGNCRCPAIQRQRTPCNQYFHSGIAQRVSAAAGRISAAAGRVPAMGRRHRPSDSRRQARRYGCQRFSSASAIAWTTGKGKRWQRNPNASGQWAHWSARLRRPPTSGSAGYAAVPWRGSWQASDSGWGADGPFKI